MRVPLPEPRGSRPIPEPSTFDDHLELYDRAGGKVVALADRRSNHLEVVLLWARRTGRLWVVVSDRAKGETMRIDATPANALEVFHHPFAYTRT